MSFPCNICGKEFSRKWTLQRHIKETHQGKKVSYKCHFCKEIFGSENDLLQHFTMTHPKNNEFTLQKKALENTVILFSMFLHYFIAVEALLTTDFVRQLVDLLDQNLKVHLRLFFLNRILKV